MRNFNDVLKFNNYVVMNHVMKRIIRLSFIIDLNREAMACNKCFYIHCQKRLIDQANKTNKIICESLISEHKIRSISYMQGVHV